MTARVGSGLRPGDVVADRYRIIRAIGRGGFGIVFEAEHVMTSRRVAVKALLDDDPDALGRFEIEARAMAKLAHPRIANVIDFHGDARPPLLVMELVTGESLAELLDREKRMDVERLVNVTVQVLEGLGAAHAVNVIHRDVKPSNIFLTRDAHGHEAVKLLDFGIAKMLDSPNAKRTATGEIVGTPAYLAPEQIRGATLDARADIHAVGVCMFEMLTGRRPWRTRTGHDLVREILHQRPLTFAEIGAAVPSELAAIVERALDPVRERRFADAKTMIEALRALSQPHAARAPSTVKLAAPAIAEMAEARAKKPTWGFVVLFAVVALVVLVVMGVVAATNQAR